MFSAIQRTTKQPEGISESAPARTRNPGGQGNGEVSARTTSALTTSAQYQ